MMPALHVKKMYHIIPLGVPLGVPFVASPWQRSAKGNVNVIHIKHQLNRKAGKPKLSKPLCGCLLATSKIQFREPRNLSCPLRTQCKAKR